MALKRTKLEKWQRNDERLERMENVSVESEITDERYKPAIRISQPKRKPVAA
jgi:hypothetical protein